MAMRKMFLGATIALMLLISLAPSALAQDPNRLAQLKISVWPEYDKPGVLVLLDGTLADKTNLPREVSVLIPSAANLFVTTWENPDGALAAEQPNKSTDLGDGYSRVTFTISQPKYRVEYYHDLVRGSPDKTIDFAFKLVAPADQVTLEVQQPLKAANFSVTPSASSTRSDADGFKYFTYQFSNIAAGQTINTQVKYTKSDPNPSVQLPVAPQPTPATAPAAPASSSTDNLLLLAGLVTLGLIVVLGLLFWQQRSRETEYATTRMSPRQFQRNRQRAKAAQAESVFCTQCGATLGPTDNFCPKCGTKRRVVG